MKEIKDALGDIESLLTKLQRTEPCEGLPLRKKQERFALMFMGLAMKIFSEGDTFTHGETYDDDGKGHIKNSAHYKKLAGDVNLFVGGVWQTTTEAHEKYGLWWERFGGSWGGRFGDGNHYSIKDSGTR